jgi:hypothetical protein
MLIQSSAKSIHLFYYYCGDSIFCMYSIHCIYVQYTVKVELLQNTVLSKVYSQFWNRGLLKVLHDTKMILTD